MRRLQETLISNLSKMPSSLLKKLRRGKQHIICEHVKPFCKKFNAPLGKYSEHELESCHYSFDKVWQRYFVRDYTNPQFPIEFLRAVIAFNSENMNREASNKKKNSKMSDIYQKGGLGSEFYENKFLFCKCDIGGGVELCKT